MAKMGEHKMRQLRIQSDGTGYRTTISLEDGTQVEGVIGATIFLDAKDANRVDLEFMLVPVDIHANIDQVTLTCAFCSHSDSHDCEGKPL